MEVVHGTVCIGQGIGSLGNFINSLYWRSLGSRSEYGIFDNYHLRVGGWYQEQFLGVAVSGTW